MQTKIEWNAASSNCCSSHRRLLKASMRGPRSCQVTSIAETSACLLNTSFESLSLVLLRCTPPFPQFRLLHSIPPLLPPGERGRVRMSKTGLHRLEGGG